MMMIVMIMRMRMTMTMAAAAVVGHGESGGYGNYDSDDKVDDDTIRYATMR